MVALIRIIFITLVVLFLMGAFGCSSSSNAPVVPGESDKNAAVGKTSRHTWGLWQFAADPEEGKLDVVQLRSGSFHLNALHFLEPPPLVNLTLEGLEFNGNIIEADIGLRHPFLGLTKFSGFDVCGILITNGSVTGFNDPDVRMAGEGDTRLLNPDGYSRWWNPAEFPVNNGTMFSYKDGLLGAPDSIGNYNSTINAYKYFCDDLGPNDPLSDVTLEKRGMFSVGQKNVRHYTIDMGAGLIFNYAVDACWVFPSGSYPWTAPDDFAPEANRAEAWRISVGELENSLYNDGSESGGGLNLSIDVYDWFNTDLNTIRVESPGNFGMVESGTPIGGGEGYSTYQIDVTDATPGEGSIDLLISVESETVGYGGLLPGKPVTAYFMHSVAVGSEPPYTLGWARTWGGSGAEYTHDVATDGSGNIYVAGRFNLTVDFDPSSAGVDDHTSNGGDDIFLSKFDPSGNFIWARTWGGTAAVDVGDGVAVDGSGNVYVAGRFGSTVDFDPSTAGEDSHLSNGDYDVYLSKFDSSGNFLWANTWGGSGRDIGYGVATDGSGDVYVIGAFNLTVDFDPSSAGVDDHSSNGSYDHYLSKFDSSGGFLWAKTWGGSSPDYAYTVAPDGSGNVYLTGVFSGTADFDPSSTGADIHPSNGGLDVFLSKLDSSGNFLWAKTWGGTSTDRGYVVAVDGSDVYVTGYFSLTVDFDPSSAGEDNHPTNGGWDVFLSKFDSSGGFLWAKTWGGSSEDIGFAVAPDGSGNVYVTGHYSLIVDFDPSSAGVDDHTSNGDFDVYLSKFDSSGSFLWAKTWGGSGSDSGYYCAVDGSEVYVTGYFNGIVDFDPSSGVDNHSSNGGNDVFLSKFLSDGSW